MEQEKKGLRLVLGKIISVHSTIIYAVTFSLLFYILRTIKPFEMVAGSFVHVFVFNAVVALITPLSFLIGLFFDIAGEKINWLPKLSFRLIGKVMELTFIIWMIVKVDGAIDELSISTAGQLVFGFCVFIFFELLTSKRTKGTKD